MKKFTKIALAALILGAGAVSQVAAQSFLEDPRYGNSPEERQKNVGKLNFMSDEVTAKNWNAAAVYLKDLMNDAPTASVNLYVWGATIYSNKAQRATSIAEKKIYVDSLMLIYDRRFENYGVNTSNGTPVLQLKARAYMGLNPMDRAGIRQLYKEALEASGDGAKPDLVLEYFQQLVTDYKSVVISPEDLLTAYEQLNPLMEKATQAEKDQFTGLFATSGAADCEVLEGLYSRELAAKPGDADVLTKAYGLMSMAGCESEFYISVAEQLYAIKPSSDVAIRLAMLFEKQQQFDKALKYLAEMIETETDPSAKANLYVRVAASELGQKRGSAAAQAARQAIALDGGNGYAHMFLAEAYIGGAAQCSGFHAQTVFWLAYDELARAREAFEGDAAMQETVSNRMASCRSNFPTKEDAFMYVEGYADGKSYTVNCGWVSGTTTTRSR